jgi:pyrimidine-nucleoside phosphorylase
VREAIALLKGEFAGNLLELCLTLGSCILTESGISGSENQARDVLEAGIRDGRALDKLAEFVAAQGGDSRAVYDVSLLPQANVLYEVPSPMEGYVNRIKAEDVGLVSMHLGGGRATKESVIDLSVGLVLHKKVGDKVEEGESLATIYAVGAQKAAEAAALLTDCFEIKGEKPETRPFIKAIIR